MKINWKYVENLFLKLAKNFLKDFAQKHPHEYFYGLYLDTNATYWTAIISLNTEPLLLKEAERYKLESPQFNGDKTIQQLSKDLRWSSADWGYFEAFDPQYFKSPYYSAEFEKYSEQAKEYYLGLDPEEDPLSDEIKEKYMTMMCRILIRLEQDKSFALLNKSQNFQTLCMDHDDTEKAARKRLAGVRKEYQ